MTYEFYGATSAAREKLNRLLKLPATGQEQDWEIELADPARVGEMLEIATSSELSLEDRFALSSLIIASLEEGVDHLDVANEVDRTRQLLDLDGAVKEAMSFYWIQQDQFTNDDLMRDLGLL